MTNKPYVLFINPLWAGHIPPAMCLYWQFFMERGWNIHNLVDQPGDAARFCACHFGADASHIQHSGFPELSQPTESVSEVRRIEMRWKALGKAVEIIRRDRGEPALVFNAWADLWTNIFLRSECVRRALLLPWVGLCVHPVEFRVRKTWKRRLWEMIPNLWRYGLPT
jgi:hypothetical protein